MYVLPVFNKSKWRSPRFDPITATVRHSNGPRFVLKYYWWVRTTARISIVIIPVVLFKTKLQYSWRSFFLSIWTVLCSIPPDVVTHWGKKTSLENITLLHLLDKQLSSLWWQTSRSCTSNFVVKDIYCFVVFPPPPPTLLPQKNPPSANYLWIMRKPTQKHDQIIVCHILTLPLGLFHSFFC